MITQFGARRRLQTANAIEDGQIDGEPDCRMWTNLVPNTTNFSLEAYGWVYP
jgi:hypothetical protein